MFVIEYNNKGFIRSTIIIIAIVAMFLLSI